MLTSRQWKTAGVGAVLVLVFFGVVVSIFAPAVSRARSEIGRQAETLKEYESLITRKREFESEWERKKNVLSTGVPLQELVNIWQKALMGYAQAESLLVEKIEPAGQSAGEISVFLSFQGEMKKTVRFLYRLLEDEPLTRVKSFAVRQEEGAKSFLFEIMLGKAAG